MIYNCESCGKSFSRPGQKVPRFCSRACKSAASKSRDVSCEVCGKTFHVCGGRPARFCGRACKGIASRLPEKACKTCGKIFKPRMGCGEQPHCSKACAGLARRQGEHKECAWCGKRFYVPKCQQAIRFCSRKCADAWQGREKTEHVCKICGKTFRWSPSRIKSNRYPITYCSIKCRNADPERQAMLIQMNAQQQEGKTNRLEAAGYALLDSLGVAYNRQFVIGGKFCVDAFVPSVGTVIQFDGDYWHGNPGKFPEPNARQKRRIHLDRSQDAYMEKCGYRVVRIWESDMKSSLNAVRERLRPRLTPQ